MLQGTLLFFEHKESMYGHADGVLLRSRRLAMHVVSWTDSSVVIAPALGWESWKALAAHSWVTAARDFNRC